MAEGIVEDLDLREMGMDVDDSLDEEALRGEVEGTGSRGSELKRREEVSDRIASLVERGIVKEERDVEREEEERTGSGIVEVAS